MLILFGKCPNYLCLVLQQVEQLYRQFFPLLSYLTRRPWPCALSIGQPILEKSKNHQYQLIFKYVKHTVDTVFTRCTNISRFPVVVQSKTTYMRMGSYPFYSGNISHFLHLGYRCGLKQSHTDGKIAIKYNWYWDGGTVTVHNIIMESATYGHCLLMANEFKMSGRDSKRSHRTNITGRRINYTR